MGNDQVLVYTAGNYQAVYVNGNYMTEFPVRSENELTAFLINYSDADIDYLEVEDDEVLEKILSYGFPKTWEGLDL